MTDYLAEVAEDSVRGSFNLFSGTAVATCILAIASILVGRLLSPELYGLYTLALMLPELLFLFADLGINQGIIKFTASLRVDGKGESVVCKIARGIASGILWLQSRAVRPQLQWFQSSAFCNCQR